MKKIFKILFLSLGFVLLFSFFVSPAPASAQNTNCMTEQQCTLYEEQNKVPTKFKKGRGGCKSPQGLCVADLGEIKLNVPLPKKSTVSSIEEYIRLLFQFLVGASGVVAVAMMVLGGYTYLTAAGNQARVSRAKEYITDALIGMVLVFGSYLFLKQINDKLVRSDPLAVEVISPQELSKSKFCKDPVGTGDEQAKCGEITTEEDGGASCRSKYCGEGLTNKVCLPVSIGGPNNLLAFECMENKLDSFIEACNDATQDWCDYINEFIKVNNEVTTDKCIKSSEGCGYGERDLFCPVVENIVNSKQVSCSKCGGVLVDDDEDYTLGFNNDIYSCSNGEQVSWHDDGIMSNTWGAVCCSDFAGELEIGRFLWTANEGAKGYKNIPSTCKIPEDEKTKVPKPDGHCVD